MAAHSPSWQEAAQCRALPACGMHCLTDEQGRAVSGDGKGIGKEKEMVRTSRKIHLEQIAIHLIAVTLLPPRHHIFAFILFLNFKLVWSGNTCHEIYSENNIAQWIGPRVRGPSSYSCSGPFGPTCKTGETSINLLMILNSPCLYHLVKSELSHVETGTMKTWLLTPSRGANKHTILVPGTNKQQQQNFRGHKKPHIESWVNNCKDTGM